jgi:hypothetical protein
MIVLFFQFVLANLMDGRSIADEAVEIREECEFARLSVVDGEDSIEQVVELKIKRGVGFVDRRRYGEVN